MSGPIATIQNLYPQLKLTINSMKDLKKYRRFNNSLIHYKGPYYLMTYRLFHPRNIKKKYHDDDERTYHAWNSWWASYVDQTVLTLLKWENHRFIVLSETFLQYPERLHMFDQQFDDSRIAKLQNKYFIYGQMWLRPHDEISQRLVYQAQTQKKETAPIAKCMTHVKNCDAAVVVLAQISPEVQATPEVKSTPKVTSTPKVQAIPPKMQLKKVIVENVSMPCIFRQEINRVHGENESIEKNWGFFEASDKSVWFQYMLHPYQVISLDCTQSVTTPTPLEKIKQHFGCGLFFSPGGPLARWKPGQLIGCGHLKYQYKCLTFLNPIEQTLLHPDYVYAMWFYVIEDKLPFRFLQISHGYVPNYTGQRYSLVFPMGCIALNKSLWAISMGNGDSTPNIMTVPRSEIESKLIPAEQLDPQTYGVHWWDVQTVL
jgi:hypothetical protein